MHDLERCPYCDRLRPTRYGEHIDGVLDDVPQSERCTCPPRGHAPCSAEEHGSIARDDPGSRRRPP